MDKLFRSDQRPCDPDGGTSGAMRARGLKDTSSRPAKDLGGTLRHTIRTMLRSYDSRASGDLFCPRRQGCVANMTSNPNRITVAAPGFYPKISFRLVRLLLFCSDYSSYLPRPLTMGTQQVSAGAAVITPQHRSYRVPQGSPQVFGGP